MICPTCQKILIHAVEWWPIHSHDSYSDTFPHQATVQGLQTSVDAECLLCATFWSTLTPEQQSTIPNLPAPVANKVDDDDESPALTSMGISCHFSDRFDVHITLDPNIAKTLGGLNRSHWFQATVARGEDKRSTTKSPEEAEGQEKNGAEASATNQPQSLRFSDNTNSPGTFLQAKTWIQDCFKNHPKCRSTTEGSWHPTRLLDCGLVSASPNPIVRLIETKSQTPEGSYMTLSHSWGKGPSLTLNQASYQELLSGMPLSSMPQLFQDALVTSHQLGARYLWIDAMCIFQDKGDLSDWNREAPLMHQVYSNSICNIVAAETPDSSHSMFNFRDPDSMIEPYTDFTFEGSKRLGGFMLGQSPQQTKFSRKYTIGDVLFWDEVSQAPINRRGWVLQERYMSPRSLHFGTRQVFWECRQKNAAEVAPDGLSTYTLRPHVKSAYLDARDPPQNTSSYYDSPEFGKLNMDGYKYWDSLVGDYSACELSYPTDKMMAFSAIVKQIGTVVQDECIAGIWRRNFESQLLWCVDSETTVRAFSVENEKETTSRYETYIAPSWSWLSVKGKVTAMGLSDFDELLTRVDDYGIEYATDNKMGAIRGGWLRLSGWLKPSELLRRVGVENSYRMWDLVVNGLQVEHDASKNEWGVSLDAPQDSFEKENEEGVLHCMPAKKHQDGQFGTQVEVLLLQLINAKKGTFRRIGLARGDERTVGHLLDSKPANDSTLPCVEYKDGKHTILIL